MTGQPYDLHRLYWGRASDATPANLDFGDDDSRLFGLDGEEYGLDDFEPGETFRINRYPGDRTADAVRRIRESVASIGARACVRTTDPRDGRILIHGMKPDSTGRLSAWTDLDVGKSLYWGDGSHADHPEVRRACRIAALLEKRGQGRFIIFRAEYDEYGFFVRRVE